MAIRGTSNSESANNTTGSTIGRATYFRVTNQSSSSSYDLVIRDGATTGDTLIASTKIAPGEFSCFKKDPDHYVFGSSTALQLTTVIPFD